MKNDKKDPRQPHGGRGRRILPVPGLSASQQPPEFWEAKLGTTAEQRARAGVGQVVAGEVVEVRFDDGPGGPGGPDTAKPAAEQDQATQDYEDADGFVSAEQRKRSQDWQANAREQARGFFGAGGQEKVDARKARQAKDRATAAVDGQGLSDQAQMLKLRAESRLAADRYLEALSRSNILAPGFSPPSQDKKISAMHRIHNQMMVQACLRPLRNGVGADSLMQAVGMFATLQMLSKDFREQVGEYAQPIRDKAEARMEKRARSKLGHAAQKVESNRMLFGRLPPGRLRERLVGSDDPHDHLSRKWRKRIEKIEHRDRGNRDLYTPGSAAMTEVGLMENAFWKMREPGQDPEQIRHSFSAMQMRLHEQFAADGLDREEVVKEVWTLIGQRAEHEPELRTMFRGMAHGRLHRCAPEEVRLSPDGPARKVWTGAFENHMGAKVPVTALPVLRTPMAADIHQVHIAETMRTSILYSLGEGDAEGFAADMQGYLMGFSARMQGIEPGSVNTTIGHRIDQAEVMMATMSIDGFSKEDQRRIYSNAYVDALEQVNAQHPGLEKDLRRALGPDWQAALQAAVDDPAGFYAEQGPDVWAGMADGAGRSHSRGHSEGPFAAPTAGDRVHTERGGPDDYQPV